MRCDGFPRGPGRVGRESCGALEAIGEGVHVVCGERPGDVTSHPCLERAGRQARTSARGLGGDGLLELGRACERRCGRERSSEAHGERSSEANRASVTTVRLHLNRRTPGPRRSAPFTFPDGRVLSKLNQNSLIRRICAMVQTKRGGVRGASGAARCGISLDCGREGTRMRERAATTKRGWSSGLTGRIGKINFSVDSPALVSRFRNLRSASDGGAGNAIEISVPEALPAAP